MRPVHSLQLFYCWLLWGMILCGTNLAALAQSDAANALTITNLAQLPSVDAASAQRYQLAVNVWWADATAGRCVVQDATGVAEIEAGLPSQTIRGGERVLLAGEGIISKIGAGYRIGVIGPVVDNNGVHEMIEKSGSVFLKAGLQPLWVDWFNGLEKYGLQVEYSGPEVPRQAIPDSALCRMVRETTNRVNGLDFACYPAEGEVLPNFDELAPIKTGTVSNFDLAILPHTERIGVRFSGFLKVPRDGIYTFYTKSDDGSRLYAGGPIMQVKQWGSASFPQPRLIAPGQIMAGGENFFWAQAEGTVTFASEQNKGAEIELTAGTGRMRVAVADSSGILPSALLNHRLRVTGVCVSGFTVDGQRIASQMWVSNAKQIEMLESDHDSLADTNAAAGTLPALTTCAEVHRLTREEAQRGYPVKLRGVVTCVLPEHQAFTIQDATRGLYGVDVSENGSLPRVGDYLELEGVTDPSLFAPIVNARQLRILGAGHLPEAVRPTWDQLMNGSLDAQYVELQGIVIGINTNGLTLLTRDGRITMELRVLGTDIGALARYEDALIRVRGCLFANWDYVTHEVNAGEIRIYGADISVDEPAPADLFALPAKSAAELLLFNPQASVFQRVKVAGQILCEHDSEFFLTDGRSGLRFIVKKPVSLASGDLVEVVGFPELNEASPLLREAVVRKTGHAPLPAPVYLKDDLLRADNDAKRVQVQGVLVSERATATGAVLEMQNGVRTFLARWGEMSPLAESLPAGSKLKLTGVYAAQGGNKAIGQNISSFELLLGSAADIQVLARPPWWTLERLLFILGALACVLAVTVLWITQLHRKVEERSAELEVQIRERQRVEHQRTLEQERARIAQDLHDELGSGLTEVSMLGARARAAITSEDKRMNYLEQMRAKAQDMVVALDEIVWAMNPRHDSLASLITYFSLYAERFLGLANMAWKLEDSSGSIDLAVDSRRRHQLFLAFKEALTNVVRHSGATEVRFNIRLENGAVCLSVADNGRGLPGGERTEAMDGLANMRSRIEKAGGRFEIKSNENRPGTTVTFYVPAK